MYRSVIKRIGDLKIESRKILKMDRDQDIVVIRKQHIIQRFLEDRTVAAEPAGCIEVMRGGTAGKESV